MTARLPGSFGACPYRALPLFVFFFFFGRGLSEIPSCSTERMRDAFLRWQCRIRRISMRSHEGRPTDGMAPIASPVPGSVSAAGSVPATEAAPAAGSAPVPGMSLDPGSGSAQGAGLVARIVTVLCRRSEHSATMEFRHMARRTHDPAERREAALKFLAERYYQASREFSREAPRGSGMSARLQVVQPAVPPALHRPAPLAEHPPARSRVLAQPAVQPPIVRRLHHPRLRARLAEERRRAAGGLSEWAICRGYGTELAVFTFS